MWLRRQAPSPVSASSIAALDRLHTDGPLRVSDLARLESMTQPGVTMLVNRLAEAGYAERVPDPTDRRAALVRITTAGADVLADRRKARADVLRRCLSDLDDADQRLLEAALPAIERLIATDPSTPTGK
jgi:DNA-binding MarR family transcriptional regulator